MFRTRIVLAAALLLCIAPVPQLAYGQLAGTGMGSPLSSYGALQQGMMRAGVDDVRNNAGGGDPTRVLKDVRQGLTDADPNVRVQELKKLRDVRDPEVNKILINSLSDMDVRVRIKAIDLLGARGANEAVAPMSQLLFLRSTEPIVRLHVAAALGRMGDAQGALPVMQYLEEQTRQGGDDRARGTAVFALGEMGSEKATPLLTQAANSDKSEMVRRLAQEALQKIDGELPSAHSAELAQQKTKVLRPTDEKLTKMRELDEKLQQMNR